MQSRKQIEATRRNFNIRRLHLMHSLTSLLDPTAAKIVQHIVDDRLKDVGAKTVAEKRDEMFNEITTYGEIKCQP